MLLVMIAIGGTDIIFALDSIPAIFGLTQNVYLVFTATAFPLLGLRQLYLLIDGLAGQFQGQGAEQCLRSPTARDPVPGVRDRPGAAQREQIYRHLLAEAAALRALPEKYRARIREEEKMMTLLARAHAEHDAGGSGKDEAPAGGYTGQHAR